MPRPRVPDEIKKARGTFRPSRAWNVVNADPENEALTQYKEIANEVLGRAIKGADVSDDIEYLREAETVLQHNGIVAFTGQRYNMSLLIDLTMQAAEHWK